VVTLEPLEPLELEPPLVEAPALAIALAPAPTAAQQTATVPSRQCLRIDIRDHLSVALPGDHCPGPKAAGQAKVSGV
jgi:hypothetical protein